MTDDQRVDCLRKAWELLFGSTRIIYPSEMEGFVPPALAKQIWPNLEVLPNLEAIMKAVHPQYTATALTRTCDAVRRDWKILNPETRLAIRELARDNPLLRSLSDLDISREDMIRLSVRWDIASALYADDRRTISEQYRLSGLDLDKCCFTGQPPIDVDAVAQQLDQVLLSKLQWDLAAVITAVPGERPRMEKYVFNRGDYEAAVIMGCANDAWEALEDVYRPNEAFLGDARSKINKLLNLRLKEISRIHPTAEQLKRFGDLYRKRDIEGRRVDPPRPTSWFDAFFSWLWQIRPWLRNLLLVGVGAILVLFAIWQSLPDDVKKRMLDRLQPNPPPKQVEPTPQVTQPQSDKTTSIDNKEKAESVPSKTP